MVAILAVLRVDFAKEPANVDIGTVDAMDLHVWEDMMGVIDLFASRCPAVYPSDMTRRAVAACPT